MNHSMQTSTPIANTPDPRKSSSKTSGSKTPNRKFEILNEFASNPNSQVRFSKEGGLPYVTFVGSNPEHRDFGYRLDKSTRKSTRSNKLTILLDSDNERASENLKNLLQAIIATYESNKMGFNQIEDKTFMMDGGVLKQTTKSSTIKEPSSSTPLTVTKRKKEHGGFDLFESLANKSPDSPLVDTSSNNSDKLASLARNKDTVIQINDGSVGFDHSDLTYSSADEIDEMLSKLEEGSTEHLFLTLIKAKLNDSGSYILHDNELVEHIETTPLSDQPVNRNLEAQLDLSVDSSHDSKINPTALGLSKADMASSNSEKHVLDLKLMKNVMQSNQFNQLFASYRQRQMMYHLILPTVFIVGVSLGFAGIIPAASLFIGLMATSGLAFMAYTLAQSQLVQFDNEMIKKFKSGQALESISYTSIAMNAVVLAAMLYGITLLANPIVCLAVFTAVITVAPLVYTQHVSKSSQQALSLSMFKNDGDQPISSTNSATPK